jgi:hypothetical protein
LLELVEQHVGVVPLELNYDSISKGQDTIVATIVGFKGRSLDSDSSDICYVIRSNMEGFFSNLPDGQNYIWNVAYVPDQRAISGNEFYGMTPQEEKRESRYIDAKIVVTVQLK